MIQFEWDHLKSLQNQMKHGISFQEAQQIWHGPNLTTSHVAHSLNGEKRNATIGIIGEKIFTAIWTYRHKNIRIISVRRSRDGEKKAYYESLL
jgi:uncharacterized DUF497 family protein